MPDKPKFSHSRMASITSCGEAYRRNYLEKEKQPPRTMMAVGKSVHAAAEANFRQKIETHRDMPEDDIKDIAAESFGGQEADGIGLTREEQRRGAVRVLGEMKDKAIDLAGMYAKRIAPEYQPEFVEQKFTIELPNASHDLTGVIDLADDEQCVIDLKTSAKRLDADDAHHSLQLTIYAAGYQVLTGSAPKELRLDVMQTWAKPSRRVLRTTRGPDDFSVLANRLNMALRSIDTGVFLPAAVGAWWCSDRFCGYWATCPYVNARRGKES